MQRKHNQHLISHARELRKNMTKEEKHLWYDFLSQHPVRCYRQKILGRYIADFYCADAKLVIELDGSQHGEKSAWQYDARRTLFLEDYDMTVLRIPNSAVIQDFDSVCRYLDDEIRKRTGRSAFGK